MGETSTNIATLNMKQAIKINVKEGCEVDNPCDSNPCPQHSYCSDDWDSYSCVCDPGNPLTAPALRQELNPISLCSSEEKQPPWQDVLPPAAAGGAHLAVLPLPIASNPSLPYCTTLATTVTG